MSARAVLAGGCFWGMEDLIRKLPGVIETRVGYTGGDVRNATYRDHGTHAEAIEIEFNPEVVSYRKILEFFFQIHDPSTLNRQGNDRGTSYRSGIYYVNDEQLRIAGETILDVDASGLWPETAKTEVKPAGDFLGSGTGTSGLSRAHSERLHLSLRSPQVGAAKAGELAVGDRLGVSSLRSG